MADEKVNYSHLIDENLAKEEDFWIQGLGKNILSETYSDDKDRIKNNTFYIFRNNEFLLKEYSSVKIFNHPDELFICDLWSLYSKLSLMDKGRIERGSRNFIFNLSSRVFKYTAHICSGEIEGVERKRSRAIQLLRFNKVSVPLLYLYYNKLSKDKPDLDDIMFGFIKKLLLSMKLLKIAVPSIFFYQYIKLVIDGFERASGTSYSKKKEVRKVLLVLEEICRLYCMIDSEVLTYTTSRLKRIFPRKYDLNAMCNNFTTTLNASFS